MKKIIKILIIGAGPAGYTASIYLSRANLKPILITGKYDGGQIIKSNNIENWPGEYKKINGFKLMNNIKKQSLNFKTKIINDKIININIKNNYFKIIGKYNNYLTKTLIIATGSIPKTLGLINEKKLYGKGISTCSICDGYLYKNKTVAVIGGGNTAIEESLFLSKIVKKIYLIHRRKKLTAEKILLNKLYIKIKQKKIIFYKNYIIKKINKKNNILDNIYILSTKNNNLKKIKINGLFILIGYKPNTKIFLKKINLDKNGYIIINKNKKYKSMTNIKGIFAAGDVTNNNYKQAIIASASGCIAAIEVQKYLQKKNNN